MFSNTKLVSSPKSRHLLSSFTPSSATANDVPLNSERCSFTRSESRLKCPSSISTANCRSPSSALASFTRSESCLKFSPSSNTATCLSNSRWELPWKLDAHFDEIEHPVKVAMTQLALKSELAQCTPRPELDGKSLVLAQYIPRQVQNRETAVELLVLAQ